MSGKLRSKDEGNDRSKGSVAVIGSGPAGLTCAADLAKQGYRVTLFESLHLAGGVLVYGIREFRLPKDIVRSEVDYIKSLGVTVETDVLIGMTYSIEDLFLKVYQRKPVTFDHKGHAQRIGKCAVCHHKTDSEKCSDCHGAKRDGETPSFREAMHYRCKNCHMKVNKKVKGACQECHADVRPTR